MKGPLLSSINTIRAQALPESTSDDVLKSEY